MVPKPPFRRPALRLLRAGRPLTLVLALVAGVGGVVAGAAERSGIPVRVTEARQEAVHETVQLTGTIEAGRSSVVASDVAGVVDALLAPEGEVVEAGQPLAQIRRRPVELRLESALGSLEEARSRHRASDNSLERLHRLSDVVPAQRIDDARYESEAWLGRVKKLEAEVARLRDELERTTVRAAFAGVVTREYTEMGQWLDVGDPVVDVVSLDRLDVRLDVPERHFSRLRPGAAAEIQVDALPGRRFDGVLRSVVPLADAGARTFPALVRLPNPDLRLGVGMMARVELPLGDGSSHVLVPKDALAGTGSARHVFVVAGGLAKRIPVTPGSNHGDWVAVEGGLAAGDAVVTRGNERLAEGQAVRTEVLEYPPP
ncbi:MAG: efflux RND transporter periplasmic adaptor subunit [Acidobacteriota bacterium]